MNKKWLAVLVSIIIALGILWIKLNSPAISLQSPLPSPAPSQPPTPTPSPTTLEYDSSTDLNKELESINPKVLDSDFNE